MHHLLEVLYPYIVLFYVFDCFVYLKSCQGALSSHFGGAYTFKKPGFRFFGISPICRLFMSFNPPFFISPKGIYILKRNVCQESDLYLPEVFEFFPFVTLRTIERDGALLKIDQRSTIDFQLPFLAKQTADTFRTLSDLPDETRYSRIEKWVRSRCDTSKIKETWEESSRFFSLLGVMSVFLFVAAFILLPSVLYFDLPIHLPFFLIWMLLIYILILLNAGVTITKRRDNAQGGLRLILSFLVSPATAAHPVQHFTKHLFYSFELLAISAVFAQPAAFGGQLKNELKRLHFSILQGGSDDLTESLRMREKCLGEFLTIAGMSPEEVMSPPPKYDSDAHSYCPLCETEFLQGVDVCPDCRIRLTPFDMNTPAIS